MPPRNILVHLDSGPRTAERLALAVNLARAHTARLSGIFAQRAEAYTVGYVSVWPPESYKLAAEASKAQFEAATAGLENAQWSDLNRGSDHAVLHLMTETARHYDLVIIGQDDEDAPRLLPRELAEQLIMESGRPLLVVPYAGHYEDLGARPLIAWAESRPAARALNDALMLIKPQAKASIVTAGAGAGANRLSAGLMVEHLRAHDIGADITDIEVTEIGVMDAVLNLASDRNADLFVMGAFGGFGYPLLSRGSGTRYMLRHMTAPCLFSH